MCRVEFGDGPECIVVTDPTARKLHTCDECQGLIKPGDKYEKTFAVWGSYPSNFKTCMACLPARQWLSDECGGFVFCEAFDELLEHFHEGCFAAGRHAVHMLRRYQSNEVTNDLG